MFDDFLFALTRKPVDFHQKSIKNPQKSNLKFKKSLICWEPWHMCIQSEAPAVHKPSPQNSLKKNLCGGRLCSDRDACETLKLTDVFDFVHILLKNRAPRTVMCPIYYYINVRHQK